MEPRPFTGQRSPRGAGETVTSWPFKDAPSPAALVEMLAHGMDDGMEGQGSRVSSSPLIADWQSDTSSEYDLSSQDQG